MSILSITAILLVTREWSADYRAVGDMVSTTAPGHCGHNYADYRVVKVEKVGAEWHATCERVVRGSARNEDGTYSTTIRAATMADIQPGMGLLRD